MKTTDYFQYIKLRSDRAMIKDEWIEKVIKNPLGEEIQQDGRIRKWGFIESENKYLRVILLEDGKTVHNAFFDRNFSKRKNK